MPKLSLAHANPITIILAVLIMTIVIFLIGKLGAGKNGMWANLFNPQVTQCPDENTSCEAGSIQGFGYTWVTLIQPLLISFGFAMAIFVGFLSIAGMNINS